MARKKLATLDAWSTKFYLSSHSLRLRQTFLNKGSFSNSSSVVKTMADKFPKTFMILFSVLSVRVNFGCGSAAPGPSWWVILIGSDFALRATSRQVQLCCSGFISGELLAEVIQE